ncbi:hypothetical protein BDR07DRAFT_118532 [Suillus spraguei]|nr:hypothetical protein BDR07DRAFT_118532 [Suillus spraguei]
MLLVNTRFNTYFNCLTQDERSIRYPCQTLILTNMISVTQLEKGSYHNGYKMQSSMEASRSKYHMR